MADPAPVTTTEGRTADPPDLSAGAVYFFAVVAATLPLFNLKPNRIADGEAIHLWQYARGRLPWALLVLLAVSAVVFAVSRWQLDRRRWSIRVWAAAAMVLPFAAIHFSFERALGTLADQELARATPGTGTVLMLVSSIAAWHWLSRQDDPRGKIYTRIAVLLSVAVLVSMAMIGWFDNLSVVREWLVRRDRFWTEVARHLSLAFTAVGAATMLGIPAGILAFRNKRIGGSILGLVSSIQTVPSLAMFGLLIAPLAALSRAVPVLRQLGVSGVGAAPALIALTLYAMLPIVRNTYTALSVVPETVIESGRGMGMGRFQLFTMVEVPIAAPVVLAGIRVSAVQAIGNTAVAALIGAGGLGWFVFQGLGQAANDLIILGVIPTVLLALIVDRLFSYAHRLLPRGVGEIT